jgi:hypothetical protein
MSDARRAATESDLAVAAYAVAVVQARTFGRGTPGSTGRTPSITVATSQMPGRRAVCVTVFGVPGHAPALLVVGQARGKHQVHGLEILVDLSQPHAEFFSATDAFGEASVHADIPDNPHLAGQRLVAQWFVRDVGASKFGLAATRGIEFALERA